MEVSEVLLGITVTVRSLGFAKHGLDQYVTIS